MTPNSTIKPEAESAIRARAYQIWEEEGRPNGRHEIHWQRALEWYAHRDMAPLMSAPAVSAAMKPAVEDVSLIDGIGAKIAKQLAAEGITTLTQIAALSTAALAKIDSKLGLKGRSARDEWIVQAQELVAGGKPRAKVDQAKRK